MIDLNKLFSLAKEAALEAGEYQKTQVSASYKTSSKEVGGFNMVTEIDVMSEKMIVAKIKSVFPDHDIIGEENTYPQTGSPYKWIIDPIDGTNNFIKRIPFWAVSIACAYNGESVMGVIYNPSTNELFHAVKGGGAFRNEMPIKTSEHDTLKGSLLITGFYYDRGLEMSRNLEVIHNVLSKHILGIRRFGAASLDMCLVASGSAEGYWEHRLSIWDFAAGILIVREAGGVVLDFNGKEKTLEDGPIIVLNGKIKNELYTIIDSVFGREK